MSLNAAAVARTVEALRVAGRLRDEDAATVQMVESLALAVDSDPGNASLWREFRAALDSMMKLGEVNDDDADEITRILAALRGSSQVDDSEDAGQVDARSRGGKGRGTTGGSASSVAKRSSRLRS